MNEQDLIIQEKIKKREKTDIMLAYMLIIILLGCILFVVYLKFIKKDNSISDNGTTEYTVNYIKLSDIVSNINNNLSGKYSGISATSVDNNITISYGDLLYDVKLINNELEFKVDNNNRELSEDIYKEIIAAVCTYYSNDRTGCVNASNSIDSNTSGIRLVNDTVYINITSGVTPVETVRKTVYAAETVTSINNTDYEINMNDRIINNIMIDMNDTKITISGEISSSGIVAVKLYDADNKELDSKKLESENNFSISFDYNDKLNINSVKKYSISVE